MGVRLMLVALVASLGWDLPTGADLTAWAESGRSWLSARAEEIGAWMQTDARTSGEVVTGAEPTRGAPGPADPSDRDFAEVVEEMVAGFAAESEEETAGRAVAGRSPAFEPIGIPEDFYPGLAYALNRASEGLAAATVPDPIGGRGEPPVAPRAERLARAIALTGEALNAWAGLVCGPTVVATRP